MTDSTGNKNISGTKEADAHQIPKRFNYMKNTVALVKLDDYNRENIREALHQIIDLMALKDFLKDKSILLKPNLLAPTKNAFTPTEFVSEVSNVLKKELGVKRIIVGDSSLTKKITAITIKRCDIESFCKEDEDEVVNFFKSERQKIPIQTPNFEAEEHIYLPREIIEADIILNLPKLKTHNGFVYTGAIKNLFGLLGNKMHMHMTHKVKREFQKMLADIYFAVEETNQTDFPKVLTIMDAVIAMEGKGPRAGTPRKIGLLIAGFNSAAVDIVGYSLMNGKPTDLEVINSVARRTALPVDISHLEILGEDYRNYIVKDFKKPKVGSLKELPGGIGLYSRIRKKAMSISIKINKKRCILCESCVKHCPAHAMFRKGNSIMIARDKCIECFCCGESCPNDAISAKWWIFRKAPLLLSFLAIVGIGCIIGIWAFITYLISIF